jgi:hypothetical protein
MWQIAGKNIDAAIFAPVEPVEVLYDFEGPRTFTHRDRDGQLCLAHWCDSDYDINRFIVVPFTDALVQKLKTGEITLLEAINQPHAWILDLAHSGEIREAWSVNLSNLPEDVLPKRGTMLWPSLEPLKNARALGEEIQDGPSKIGIENIGSSPS